MARTPSPRPQILPSGGHGDISDKSSFIDDEEAAAVIRLLALACRALHHLVHHAIVALVHGYGRSSFDSWNCGTADVSKSPSLRYALKRCHLAAAASATTRPPQQLRKITHRSASNALLVL